MRFVPSIQITTAGSEARQVKGLSAAYAVKPVYPRPHSTVYVEPAEHHEAHATDSQNQRSPLLEDRRKACRRVSHLPVLVELRSGIDRRHHTLREGDVAEHIDIEV